ncbi:MAG: thiamine pyrophosphate-dependent enzyme [Pseudomonadota bacterium]
MDEIDLLRQMMTIRAFEAALMARPDHGFQLLSTGEEAVAVGLCAALGPDDQLLTSGRSIGPALARGLDSGAVMGELLGKLNGTNQGRGGRGHMASPGQGFFGAHAVVGGNLSIAAGVALASKMHAAGQVTACLFGDGACGAGVFHETLNLAALWALPLLLVCNNNQLAISTPVQDGVAVARLTDLARPFGIAHDSVDGMDVLAVRAAARRAVDFVREEGRPFFLECRSERLAPHSSATRETRSPAAMEALWSRCPIARIERLLRASGAFGTGELDRIAGDVAAEIDAAMAAADAAGFPAAEDVLHHVW